MKIFRLLLASLLLITTSHAIAGVHAYAEFKDTIAYDGLEILKKYGMPVSHDREIPWFYIAGSPGSYTIALHRSDEIPQQAILDIIKMCMDFYEQRGRKEEFNILIYKESAEVWRKSLFLGIWPARVKPFFDLTIGDKK